MIEPDLDFRTDELTAPTDAMWRMMRQHHCGWAPHGDDSAVTELEAAVAAQVGMEAGLFFMSGTMANLAAALTHAASGDRVILERTSHMASCEGDALAALGGITTVALAGKGGRVDLAEVASTLDLKPFGHAGRYKALCLENTHNFSGGAVLSKAYTKTVTDFARSEGIVSHLDGARIYNAAASLQCDVAELTQDFDSVVVNLNKALSAPCGAVLAGSRQLVSRAAVARERLGAGAMASAGYWATAGLIGLEQGLTMASRDNRLAAQLGARMSQIPGLRIRRRVESNIVNIAIDESLASAESARRFLYSVGVGTHVHSAQILRFVTHRHITLPSVDRAVECMMALVSAGGELKRRPEEEVIKEEKEQLRTT